MTDDTGYPWFFAAANAESVVEVINEVINGCSLNKTMSTEFRPIQDTFAFATCPAPDRHEKGSLVGRTAWS